MDAKDIKVKQFKKAAMFGYKTSEVDLYLQEMAAEFENLEKKNSELKEKLEILARKVRQYRSNEEQLKNAILDAQKHASELESDANEKSKEILEKARAESEKMLDEAKLKSIAMISEARTEYDKIREETQKEQSGSRLALMNLQKEVTGFKAGLVELYRKHLTQVMAMPETVDSLASDNNSKIDENQLSLEDNITE